MRRSCPRFARRCRSIVGGIALVLAPLACTSSGVDEPHRGVRSLWRHFVTLPEMRAMAIAGDPVRIWVGAAVGDEPTAAAAEAAALAACREKRIAARIQTPCRLYAMGDEIVWDPYAREGRPTSSSRSRPGAAEP
jgi:hypothetical protein